MRKVGATAKRNQTQSVRDYFAISGVPGILRAIQKAEEIPDPEEKDLILRAIIFWNGQEDQKRESIDMIAGQSLLKATLTMGDQYFRAFRAKMAWSKCQPELEMSLKISQQDERKETQSESDPITSENCQDKPQRAIDLLLHRITPANAPSAHSESRCAVRAF